MTPLQAILVIIIRLWAAEIIFSALVGVIYWPPETWKGPDVVADYMIRAYVYSGAWFVLGALAWGFAPRLARLVHGSTSPSPQGVRIDADTLVMAGGVLIGVFYLVRFFPEFAVSLGAIIAAFNQHDGGNAVAPDKAPLSPARIEELIKSALGIAIALWLAFRPAHFARMFSHLRRAGLSKHDRTGED